jgi:trehalose 6-phosphate phosphatase
MEHTPPEGTDAALSELVARCRGQSGLVLGLDFDGTLAPIHDDPGTPLISKACRSALSRFIAAPAARVAVISGRSLEDLRPRVGLGGVIYSGNHGLEIDWYGHHVTHPLAVRRRPAVDRVADRLVDRLADVPGVFVEHKGLTLTVHVRNAPPVSHEAVRSPIEAAVDEVAAGLTLASGREIVEVRPAIAWDKGAAMDAISRLVGDDWVPVYIGDDETDEDAFEAVRSDGVGVLVGQPRPTAAAYRLDHQAAVAPFLNRLATALLREGSSLSLDGREPVERSLGSW